MSKEAEMRKEITGVLSEVNRVEPTSTCKKHTELEDIRRMILDSVDNTHTQKKASAFIPMKIGEHEIKVEVTESSSEERRGLSGRRHMPDDYGMLFKRADGFWMRGVNFDLDIVFTDPAGEIKDIQTMNKLGEDDFPVVYTPKTKEASIAIELPVGWCKAKGIKPGDKVSVGEI